MTLSCDNLGWSVRGQPIVTDVSLDIRKGEVFGLVGPNGSGKSTLLKMFAGIRPPSDGRVLLDGQLLTTMLRRDVARQVALVEQLADTSERITVRDAVELGRTPWLSPLRAWSRADDDAVACALRAVGMEAYATRRWDTLSGGERQRIHIARALAQEPRILLLDEPTNHLDIHHQLSILALVAGLPVTSIVALHDLNHAMTCDRIGVMEAGRLVALGTPDEVLTPDRLGGTFAVQARLLTDPADGGRILRFHRPA